MACVTHHTRRKRDECLCYVYKDAPLEDYIAVPDNSCGITASLDAASSVVPPTLGLRQKPFDEAGFHVWMKSVVYMSVAALMPWNNRLWLSLNTARVWNLA